MRSQASRRFVVDVFCPHTLAVLDTLEARILYADTTFRNAAKAALSYVKPPYVEWISESSGSFAGGLPVEVRGRRFGTREDDLVAVWLGKFECKDVVWHGNNCFTFRTPEITARDLQELGLDEKGTVVSLLVD